MAKQRVVKKKKVQKNIADAVLHIKATYNNTVVTITDNLGNTIAWSSAGVLGFKGSKKSTPFAAGEIVEDVLMKAKEQGVRNLGIKVQGPGSGRDAAVKTVGSAEGINVRWFKDVSPLPHNGCRRPKKRRN